MIILLKISTYFNRCIQREAGDVVKKNSFYCATNSMVTLEFGRIGPEFTLDTS